jgi:hypothetical protein
MVSEEAHALLAGLVVTQNLTIGDAEKQEEFLAFVDEVNVDIPDLYVAIDLALDFFNDDPDTESENQAKRVEAAHADGHIGGTCPDCGGPSMDDFDIEQAITLWGAVRDVCDKYNFDMFAEHGEAEEC